MTGDGLTADRVLLAAMPPNSPLHQHIEWDTAQAAAAWQRLQATCLIEAVTTTVTRRV